jgi:hypothetical protein
VAKGRPDGDVTPFGEVLFPFDAALRDTDSLIGRPVVRVESGPQVEERYTCGAAGAVEVEIRTDDGYVRRFALRRG